MRRTHPNALFSVLTMKSDKKQEKLERLLATAKHEFQLHLRMRTDEPEYSLCLLDRDELANIIRQVELPLAGHTNLEALSKFERGFSICEASEVLHISGRGQHTFEGFYFGNSGELIRDVAVEVHGSSERMSREEAVIRIPHEKRPVTTHEAWACIGALTRSFLPVEGSLHKITRYDLENLHSIARDLRNVAARLRQPNLGHIYHQDQVVSILCERRAMRFEELHRKWKRRKDKGALVQLMGPCGACFELLFGEKATGGSDYKPSHFTRFVASYLSAMKVPQVNFQTVRRYFQRWEKLDHRAVPPILGRPRAE
jgi:hypothetical protein